MGWVRLGVETLLEWKNTFFRVDYVLWDTHQPPPSKDMSILVTGSPEKFEQKTKFLDFDSNF